MFKQNGTDLEYAGGVFTNGGPLACTKLYVPDSGRVRTHFERRVSTTQIQKLSEATKKERNYTLAAEDPKQLMIGNQNDNFGGLHFGGVLGRAMDFGSVRALTRL